MDQLKKEIIALLDELNQSWVKEDSKAKKDETYIDSTIVMGKCSEIVNKIEDSFINARKRMKVNKKSMFGFLG